MRHNLRFLIVPAIIFYAASLALPTIYCAGWTDNQSPPGVQLLMAGWMGIANLEFRWFANPVFFIAFFLHFTKSRPPEGTWKLIGTALLIFAIWTYAMPFEACGSVHLRPVESLGIGAHLWCLSLLLAGLSCFSEHGLRATSCA